MPQRHSVPTQPEALQGPSRRHGARLGYAANCILATVRRAPSQSQQTTGRNRNCTSERPAGQPAKPGQVPSRLSQEVIAPPRLRHADAVIAAAAVAPKAPPSPPTKFNASSTSKTGDCSNQAARTARPDLTSPSPRRAAPNHYHPRAAQRPYPPPSPTRLPGSKVTHRTARGPRNAPFRSSWEPAERGAAAHCSIPTYSTPAHKSTQPGQELQSQKEKAPLFCCGSLAAAANVQSARSGVPIRTQAATRMHTHMQAHFAKRRCGGAKVGSRQASR